MRIRTSIPNCPKNLNISDELKYITWTHKSVLVGNISFESFLISWGKHFFLQFLPFLWREIFILLLFQLEIHKILSRTPGPGPAGPSDNQALYMLCKEIIIIMKKIWRWDFDTFICIEAFWIHLCYFFDNVCLWMFHF